MKTIFLIPISALPIVLGIFKIYAHFYSSWRFGYLDYLIAAGLILGGLFLFIAQPVSKAVVLASSILIAFELYKAVIDYYDHFDVFLAILAITYLIIPLLKSILEHFFVPNNNQSSSRLAQILLVLKDWHTNPTNPIGNDA